MQFLPRPHEPAARMQQELTVTVRESIFSQLKRILCSEALSSSPPGWRQPGCRESCCWPKPANRSFNTPTKLPKEPNCPRDCASRPIAKKSPRSCGLSAARFFSPAPPAPAAPIGSPKLRRSLATSIFSSTCKATSRNCRARRSIWWFRCSKTIRTPRWRHWPRRSASAKSCSIQPASKS